ncbi:MULTISPECIES: response regulator [Roseivirga]|uniref:response regulator n=1 Tax=Roseivirga TaxID=290180 RepID=UPI00257D5B3C|nr:MULTISPECIES: response regulator [Roseivirga]MEC7754878.1 response regulator [Bacteroidota bacterium]|tara:strand:- start:30196 stop:30606 length:411 start_codon:yes stop_codon:yes gene_type:complete
MKLDCIMLIDDDEATNFVHKMVISQIDCAKEVVEAHNGQEAIDYLKERAGKQPQPELIFLDINMPVMDGWEFLEEYEKLDEDQKGGMVVVMLTTSLNPHDREMATKMGVIHDFMNKPLTKGMLAELIDRHFGNSAQ